MGILAISEYIRHGKRNVFIVFQMAALLFVLCVSASTLLAEYRLYQSFDGMIGEKSAVYISHRLSSTRFCDTIAMFKGGEMVEYGTHEELLENCGLYQEIFDSQFPGEREKKEGNV